MLYKEAVKRLAKDAGMNNEQLAHKVGMSPTQLSTYKSHDNLGLFLKSAEVCGARLAMKIVHDKGGEIRNHESLTRVNNSFSGKIVNTAIVIDTFAREREGVTNVEYYFITDEKQYKFELNANQ